MEKALAEAATKSPLLIEAVARGRTSNQDFPPAKCKQASQPAKRNQASHRQNTRQEVSACHCHHPQIPRHYFVIIVKSWKESGKGEEARGHLTKEESNKRS
jgi:hypothetical protein